MINNNIAIILVAPQLGENIGASARAMKNFGLRDLRIVAPRDGWPNKKAESMSVGAIDIINQAKVFSAHLQSRAVPMHRVLPLKWLRQYRRQYVLRV